MNLSLPELVQVAKEIEDMVTVALRERDWGCLVLQVLAKSVPVSAFLRLISAKRLRCLLLIGSGGGGGALYGVGIFSSTVIMMRCRHDLMIFVVVVEAEFLCIFGKKWGNDKGEKKERSKGREKGRCGRMNRL